MILTHQETDGNEKYNLEEKEVQKIRDVNTLILSKIEALLHHHHHQVHQVLGQILIQVQIGPAKSISLINLEKRVVKKGVINEE